MLNYTALIKTAVVVVLMTTAGCGGGSAAVGTLGTGGNFVLLRTIPDNYGLSFLNESIAFDFSNKIDITSADFSAVTFAVFDLNGNAVAEPVEGLFRLGTARGDDPVKDPVTGEITEGRRMIFEPKFASNDSYDDGGLRPSRKYIVQLLKGDHRRNVGLIDISGRGLDTAASFTFTTVDGTTPKQLYKDTLAGGPRKSGFSASPLNPQAQKVELNELGQVATEIRLSFNQPVNPHSANLPLGIDLDPRTRSIHKRGLIYLEYDDPLGDSIWIPAALEIERNQLDGAIIVLRPLGILPNNARIRVIVEKEFEDLSGESNAGDALYDRVFAEFDTMDSYEVGFDALVLNFVSADSIDFSAGFVEPLAEVVPGAVRANFDFEGSRTNLRYEPTSQEVVLDTNFTQIQPSNGQAINVANGIFMFRDVVIPTGVTVRGVGTNPMVWLVTGDFEVSGRLLVVGGDGQRVDTLNSANFPTGGGVGNCGGGNGGQASQLTNSRTLVAESGFGPGQVPGLGGVGGRLSCVSSCSIGSAGGGGSFVTQGDPYYKADATRQWVQPNGIGGFACNNRNSRSLAGGDAGPVAFVDPRPDNDFWGSAVNVHLGTRITGEMVKPHGGQGGGGGGDFGVSCVVPDRRDFAMDEKGGGGGAGGGVLIIKALGSIVITKTGVISANGGDGGGGAYAGGCSPGGGGGAGSGGMVVLMAGRRIQIHKHGGPYAAPNNNYNFAISADGGVGRMANNGSNVGTIRSKYDPVPHRSGVPKAMNARPSGGFGGLGLIQLMAPPGPNPGEDDETNTLLDDNIDIIDPNTLAKLEGADKQRFLAWRGSKDPNGVPRDDAGVEVAIGKGIGDIRPCPILMPAPYGTRSRIRSRWIDLGAANRRMTAPGGDGLPRGVGQAGSFSPGDLFGPRPEFFGLADGDMTTDPLAGYIKTKAGAVSGVEIDYPEISGLTKILVSRVRSVATGIAAPYRGHSKYIEVTLQDANATLAALPQRYSHYTAAITQSLVSQAREFRILGHDDRTIYLKQEGSNSLDVTSSPSNRVEITIYSKLFSVFTGGVEGFPQSFVGRPARLGPEARIPRANIRIGFAFHQDPKDPNAKRFPPLNAGKLTFFGDWSNPLELQKIHTDGYRFVMYDILFNTKYQESISFPNSNTLGPDTPRPELRQLILPYRY